MRALLAVTEAEALGPRRVLEVAAGDASLAASLQARTGCEVWANDLREEHLRAVLRRYWNGLRIRLAPGNLFELDPSIGKFDLVAACEVIEHVAHGVEFLRKMSGLTAPDGHLLITTPNGAYFRNHLPAYYDIPDHSMLEKDQFSPDADGHLFLVRPREMYRMAQEAGLRVERLALWGSPFLAGHAGFRMLGGLLPIGLCLALEKRANSSPLREKLCSAISVVLRPL